jgi:hypothetical protein
MFAAYGADTSNVNAYTCSVAIFDTGRLPTVDIGGR